MASSELSAAERERLAAIRASEGLADLRDVTGADSDHDAYFAAKAEWTDLRERELPPPDGDGLPGARVEVDGHAFHVHGITHADTEAEGEFLREQVAEFLADGATVYCEEGLRRMYFDAFPDVCVMDDYHWALEQCADLEGDSHVADLPGAPFDGLLEEFDSLTAGFREAAFSLIEREGDRFGEEFQHALGDVASAFLSSHEDVATGKEFESFALSRAAAGDPGQLGALQRYYETRFLPQPVEREWLRRHDPELELVTHARNERMADYAVYHNEEVGEIHLIVGAAHQPGVRYYLEQHRDGERDVEGFEFVG